MTTTTTRTRDEGTGEGGSWQRVPVQLRFSDTDMIGHVNNAVFATMTEVGRIHFFEKIRGGDIGNLILARLAIDFRRQVRLGQEVVVETRVARLGQTSMTLEQRILADEEVAAEAEVVVVHFDYREQRPTPLPEAWREQLSPAG